MQQIGTYLATGMSAPLSLASAQRSHCQDPFKLPAGRTIHALQFNYQYKQLISATIVAGWDESEGGQVSHNPRTFSSH